MNEVNEIIETKLMPVMSIDETVAAFKQYQNLRKKLAEKGDFISFGSGKGEKEAPTKQWRVKLSRYFGLCAEITKEWDTKEDDNSITYHKRARVTHTKSGLFYEATGACNTGEKERDGAKKYHNAESHAETRAKNRVVFEFVGFGEVSAEEMTGSHDDHSHTSAPKPNADLATMPQVTLIKKQIISSHLLTEGELKKISGYLENGLTKTKASEIIGWWLDDKQKGIKGEHSKREAKEKEAKPAEKTTGRSKDNEPLEKREEEASGSSINKDEIAPEDMPF